MAKNDPIVLRANFSEWKKDAGDLGGVDPWLYYCLEQFLKPFTLDDDEVQFGITDGGGDGAADAIYFIVNQRQLVTEDNDLDPRGVSKIRLLIFQVKTSGGFKPTQIEKWVQFTDDLLDLTKKPECFGTRYSKKVKSIMSIWKDQYLKVSGSFPSLAIDYYYISQDDVSPDAYAIDAGERVKAVVDKHLQAERQVHYIGANELWKQVQRRPPKSKTLVWSEPPMGTEEGFVGLVKLKDYCEFLADEPDELAERIFESNVRGFQQDSSVNDGIYHTLVDQKGGANFWLLNNGVTIITPKAAPAGHLRLEIEDPQIVNGLQTSRVIFRYITSNDKSASADDTAMEDNRAVLIRVIQTSNQALRDMIIKATNSQNKMSPASLRMTDQIHRDIEEIFKKVDLYYDRRKGFYRDQRKPVKKIISVNAVAQAVISVILQRPDDARARPGNYFKDDDKYNSVFCNEKIPPQAYLICVQLVQRVEKLLYSSKIDRGDIKNLKFYIAATLATEITGMDNPIFARIPADSKISDETINKCYRRVNKIYEDLSKRHDKDAVARGSNLLAHLKKGKKRRKTPKVNPVRS